MRFGARLAAFLAGACLLVPLAPIRSAAGTGSTPDTELVVLVDDPAAVSEVVDAVDGVLVDAPAPDTIVVAVDARESADALATLGADPAVTIAEPNRIYRATRIPDDPCIVSCLGVSQWHLGRVGAFRAWDRSTGSPALVVAVLDSAVRFHPDLDGKVTYGPDFSNPLLDCSPGPGFPPVVDHGTHVAGIVGAHTDNGLGVAGLGWQTRVLGVGVLNQYGCGTTASVVSGIRHAADSGARILNLSLSGPPSDLLANAIADANGKGALVVAAAGNSGLSFPEYPAAYSSVAAVAATDRFDALAPFSTRGSWVDFAAPGEDVLSTYVNGATPTYRALDGSSFAAPQFAATAALMLAANRCLTNADVRRIVASTARPVSGGAGAGRIDTGAALASSVEGYRVAGNGGVVATLGAVCDHGDLSGVPLHRPVVGAASTPSGNGYWLVASDGGIFSFGDARFFGSTGAVVLNRPVVGMASTPSGNGYWLVASDGGIFSFGDARFFGSTGGIALAQPIIVMLATTTGRGYWLLGRDGGIFTFGDARFHGAATGAVGAAVALVPARAPSR